MRLSRLRLLRPGKRLLIITGVLLVLISICYVLWSRQVWAQLTPNYTQWRQTIKTDVDAAIILPTATLKEQDAVMTKLVGISNKINTDQRTICSVNGLVRWQQNVIPAYQAIYSACQKKVATTVDFQKQLAVVVAYSKDDQALAKIIAAIPQSSEQAEDTWESQMTAWAAAAKATEKLAVSDSFQPTRQLAVKHMTMIKSAWQEMITAHEVKDKQKYLTAQGSLATAIDGLDEVALMSQQTITKLSSNLEVASQKAFAE